MKIAKLSAHRDSSILKAQNRSRAMADALRQAMSQSLQPVPVAPALRVRFTASLPDDVWAALREMAEAGGMQVSDVAAGLVAALEQQGEPQAGQNEAEENPIDAYLPKVRAALHELTRDTWGAMEAGRIVFAEAPTGAGKGRMIAALATAHAHEGRRVVISAPLIVARQLVREIRELDDRLEVALALGRVNFVDLPTLHALVEESGEEPALERWIEAGAPALADWSRSIAKGLGYFPSGLAEDAYSLANDRSIVDQALAEQIDSEEDNPQHARNIEAAKNAQIIIMSHTMLAAETRLLMLRKEQGGRLLPERMDALIVDEAHQLEQAFAGVVHFDIHLHALSRHISRVIHRGRKACLRALSDLYATVSDLAGRRTHPGSMDDFDTLRAPASALFDELNANWPKKAKDKEAVADSVHILSRAMYALKSALDGYGLIGIEKTPVKQYPVLRITTNSPGKMLSFMWERTDRAALVSATLYHFARTGPSIAYMRNVLSVPADRTATPPPAKVPWIAGAASVHICPGAHNPPSSRDEPSFEAYYDDTAAEILDIYQSARGGTVALLTSFEAASELAERLAAHVPDLIVQTPSETAHLCAQKFRAAYAEGRRPLWLALGSAWTGMDLSDSSVPADQDFLLTDLIVVRIPWRTNRTLTHARRTAWNPQAEYQETVRMFRQGIGRLVRREGVSDRRLFVLDRRIMEPKNSGFRKAIEALFGQAGGRGPRPE